MVVALAELLFNTPMSWFDSPLHKGLSVHKWRRFCLTKLKTNPSPTLRGHSFSTNAPRGEGGFSNCVQLSTGGGGGVWAMSMYAKLMLLEALLSMEFWVSETNFFFAKTAHCSFKKPSILRTYSWPKPPLPPCTQLYAIWKPPSPPGCVRTKWMPPWPHSRGHSTDSTLI